MGHKISLNLLWFIYFIEREKWAAKEGMEWGGGPHGWEELGLQRVGLGNREVTTPNHAKSNSDQYRCVDKLNRRTKKGGAKESRNMSGCGFSDLLDLTNLCAI